jgi:glutamate-1-semialdehyde 2,1-aminomutase
MNIERSTHLFVEAKRCLPGGVSSPVRAYNAVGGVPRFINEGRGAYIFDVDGRKYVDYVMAYGPLIFGHRHPAVTEAIEEALARGTGFGAPSESEIRLAGLIKEAFPFVDLVRFVNSGTEATMSAVRLARAQTGRDYVLKFEGCYHGHADTFLVRPGSGGSTSGIPSSPGIPKEVVRYTLVTPYNDIGAVERIFEQKGRKIAAIIVEPVAGNMGVVLPKKGFLQGLREASKSYGALLIFDEVITGFRVAFGGISTKIGVEPDILTLGKIIGGGLPVGALCGKRSVMELLAPQGPLYQAGTFSGNPLSMSAGMATLRTLKEENPYGALRRRTERLIEGLRDIFKAKGIPVVFNHETAVFSMFFTRGERVMNLSDAQSTDKKLYAELFHALLAEGVMLPPSPYEALFLSTAHGDTVIEETLKAFGKAVARSSLT